LLGLAHLLDRGAGAAVLRRRRGLEPLDLLLQLLDLRLGRLEQLGDAVLLRLLGLGLELRVLELARHAHDLAAVADVLHEPAEAAVLLLGRLELRRLAVEPDAELVALAAQRRVLLDARLAVGAQLLEALLEADQADAPLLEHALLLADDLAQVLDLAEL